MLSNDTFLLDSVCRLFRTNPIGMYKYTQNNVYLYMAGITGVFQAVLTTKSQRTGKNNPMKQQRHAVIQELLVKTAVTSQDELRRKLAGRGFHVTQATLSRDIHELRLNKGPEGYSLPSGSDNDEDALPGIREVLESFGLEVRQAMNLLVLVTTTGSAQPIAAGIDYEDWPEVVGTIAGDDTVLIICPDEKQANLLKTRIEGYLG
jgi:transcriptional regulator of arginine metabolism